MHPYHLTVQSLDFWHWKPYFDGSTDIPSGNIPWKWSMFSICRCFPISTKICRGLSSFMFGNTWIYSAAIRHFFFKSEIVTPLQCSMHSWRLWSLRSRLGVIGFMGFKATICCNHVCVLCILYIIIYNQYIYIYIHIPYHIIPYHTIPYISPHVRVNASQRCSV